MITTEKSKDIYLVIKHTQVPSKKEQTHMKDWKKTGKWDTYEEVTVTDGLKKLQINEATVIINVSQMKFEKNRNAANMSEEDIKKLYVAYMQKYQENIAQFYVRFRPQLLEEMVKERAKQESIKKAEEDKQIKENIPTECKEEAK